MQRATDVVTFLHALVALGICLVTVYTLQRRAINAMVREWIKARRERATELIELRRMWGSQ